MTQPDFRAELQLLVNASNQVGEDLSVWWDAVDRACAALATPLGPPKNCWLDDEDDLCPSPCVFDDPSEVISNCIFAETVKCKTDCKYYRAATPPPEPPADGDKEESERLRSLFDLTRHQMADALGVDRGYGWTSLAIEAKQLREDRAPNFCALCAALDLEAMKLHDKGYSPKPPPEPPTDDELSDLWTIYDGIVDLRDFVVVARAVLERWGRA